MIEIAREDKGRLDTVNVWIRDEQERSRLASHDHYNECQIRHQNMDNFGKLNFWPHFSIVSVDGEVFGKSCKLTLDLNMKLQPFKLPASHL